ncbi:AraC family transcriptional regulator [Dyadobacter psychrotolerans]|uniref:Helix-turn-helix domain-containing protein n=1 Tax=Dyadobacter psychrotolerans TaxID=2541721 RepID=A0A4R5DB19_9BACT|nr:helix-turn-helix transcriptional regulator [Dyadobacter psychrotolerans]TDE10829.1 helix-turn-helix domain-containing protein [Dyadobacter psychrotolerans]
MKTKVDIPTLGISQFQMEHQQGERFQYHQIDGARFIEKPHKHDFFLFLLFQQGSGKHTIDFVDYQVGPNQIHLLFPDQVHSWKLDQSTRAYQIMISKRSFETFSHAFSNDLIQYQNHPVLGVDDQTFEKLLYEFQSIANELLSGKVLWDMLSARCQIIAHIVSRQAAQIFEKSANGHSKPVLAAFQLLINKHFKEQKSVSFYASQLNVSPNYLNILCKRHLQHPATWLIHARLTLEAKRRLLTSKQPIKEISYELGFYDLAYFSKFFKSQTGLAPRQFRDLS